MKKIGIFHTAFVGDVALLGKLIDKLREEKVYLFSKKIPLNLYKDDPRVHYLIPIDKGRGFKKFFAIFTIAKLISSYELDILLFPHKSLTTRLIVFLSRVSIKIGFKKVPGAKVVFYDKQKHESERMCDLLSPLPELSQKQGQFRLGCRTNEEDLSSAFVPIPPVSGPFFLVSPGSVWATKKYPISQLAEVILNLLQETELFCVINGGPSDRSDVYELLKKLKEKSIVSQKGGDVLSRLYAYTGELPLDGLILLTKKAEFIISNDSAPLHIASGTNTPTVCFFGPTSSQTGYGPLATSSLVLDYGSEFGLPLSCQPCSLHGQRHCPLGHHNCMRQLSPHFVSQKIMEFWKKIEMK